MSEKSAVSVLIDGSRATWGDIDQTSMGTLSSFLPLSTVTLQSKLVLSNKSEFLKSSTKNPDLNLVNPSASWTWSVLVSNSSKPVSYTHLTLPTKA